MVKFKKLIFTLLGGIIFPLHFSYAQTPPQFTNPIHLIVGYAPGGASDRAARLLAEQLQDTLEVAVIVENKTGAGGRIAAHYTKQQPESKDVIIIGNPAVMVVAPLVFEDLPYHPKKDFTPIAGVTKYTFGIAVANNSPWTSLDELLSWARENPEKFNIAVPAYGSLPHFFSLMLSEQAGVQAEAIGYRGSAPALNDLIGGSIPVGIDTIDILTAHHNDKLRILATSGEQQEDKLPDVPTFKDSGINLTAYGWNAIFAPKTMDPIKVQYLGKIIKEIMSKQEIQERFLNNDLPPINMDSLEISEEINRFTNQWEPIIKASGYKVN